MRWMVPTIGPLHARAASRGTTFVELMGAITIISLATLVMLQQLTISYREGTIQHERLWGYDKCTQILAEIQSAVERGTIPDAEALHALADTAYNPVLTTVPDQLGQPLPPDHAMSGNWQRLSRWVWARQIEVTSPPGQDRIRYIALRLAKYADNGVPIVISSMTTVVTLPRRTYPSTTVYDVYALALAEVPSPLGPLPEVRSSLQSTLRAASSAASGVDFRIHWITRLGYGRELLYAPLFNTDQIASEVDPKLYWYPELVTSSARLFVSDYFTGRHRNATGMVNDYDSSTRPYPHAIADQFNHCMRLPAARDLYLNRVDAGSENPSEPPLQILLADMNDNPDRYRNAIMVNLHGDGIPFPPVRNYSDPASAPETILSARVVTHPARLQTPRDVNGDGDDSDTENLELRVYAFNQDVAAGSAVLSAPITVQVFGGDFRSHLTIRRLQGGLDLASGSASGSASYSSFDSATGNPPTSSPGNFAMWCETGYSSTPTPHTWIRLHNTPLVCPAVSTEGLPASERLYGMDYIPTPLGSTPFDEDLDSSGSYPKNTARWRLRIAKTALGTIVPNTDQMLTVSTRIGTDLSTGTLWPAANQPRNLSTTYAWWTRSATAVPPLERYQLLGDPRHNPYSDVAASGGYNCYFAGSGIPLRAFDWEVIDPLRLHESGFGDGVTSDVPRALSVWRDALQSAGVVFVNVSQLANRLYVGGEIGGPASGTSMALGKIALPGAWFDDPDSTLVESVSPGPSTPAAPPAEPMASFVGEHVLVGPGSFWVKPWLGELFADADYGEWFSTGNLAVVSYHRVVRSQSTLPDLPSGAVFYGIPTGATAGTLGATSFVQVGDVLGTFAHQFVSGATGTVTRDGRIVPKLFGFEWAPTLSAVYPFSFALPGNPAAPHFTHPTDFPAQAWQLIDTQIASSGPGLTAGGLFRVSNGGGATTFIDLIALSPSSTAETESLLDLGAAESVRALQAAGSPGLTGRIEQIGRVEIVDPPKGGLAQNPGGVVVTWRVNFMGFDGQLPASSYPVGFTEAESTLCYSVLYSRDAGDTWHYVLNDAVAKPGVRPTPTLLIPDAGTGNESLTVPTPSSTFPAGEVLWRVEAFHATRECHYGHHTVLMTVTR